MSRSINLEKLKSNLPQEKDPDRFPSGLFKAIEASHNETKSDEVDWGSFTLAEAEMALDHAMGYEHYEDFDNEGRGGHPNRENAVHQYLHNTMAISSLKRSKPVTQAANDVEFF
jgi:hypothetical protein